MNILSSLPRSLRPLTLGHRREIERDVYDELRFHVEMCVQDNLAAGMTPAEARSEAERSFGDSRAIADACLSVQTQHPLRVALRATETLLTLALAFGLAATVFLLANAVFFRAPVSFHDDARRVGIWWHDSETKRWYSGSTHEEFRVFRGLALR